MYAGRKFSEKKLCIPIFLISMNHPYSFGVIGTTQGSLYESYELGLAQPGHS